MRMDRRPATSRPRSVRLLLGTLQMVGAVTSLVPLFAVGVVRETLAAVVATSMLTTVTVLLCGSQRTSGKDES